MRRDILIPLMVAMALAVCNICNAGISENDRHEFNAGLSRIDSRRENYQARKQADRLRRQKQAERKQAEIGRQKRLKEVGRKNKALARQKKINDTIEARRRAKKNGGCYFDEILNTLRCN